MYVYQSQNTNKMNKIGSVQYQKSILEKNREKILSKDQVIEHSNRTTRDTLQVSQVVNRGIRNKFDTYKNPKQRESI